MKKAVFALVALVLLGGGIYLFYGPELHIRSGLPTPSKAVSTPMKILLFVSPQTLKH